MKFYPAKIFIALMLLTTVSCSEYNKLLEKRQQQAKVRQGSRILQCREIQQVAHPVQGHRTHLQSIRSGRYRRFLHEPVLLQNGGFREPAPEQFDEFRRRFGRSPFLEESEYDFAKGFYYLSPKPENDQSFTFQAMQAISEYLDRYPKSQKRDELLEKTWSNCVRSFTTKLS